MLTVLTNDQRQNLSELIGPVEKFFKVSKLFIYLALGF